MDADGIQPNVHFDARTDVYTKSVSIIGFRIMTNQLVTIEQDRQRIVGTVADHAARSGVFADYPTRRATRKPIWACLQTTW